jgi:hypothetical protein
MAKMIVELKGGDFADQKTEWNVPEELVRPYSTFLAAWIAKGFLEASLAVAESAGNPEVAGAKLLEKSG